MQVAAHTPGLLADIPAEAHNPEVQPPQEARLADPQELALSRVPLVLLLVPVPAFVPQRAQPQR
jgi:hypothetical protein